MNKSSAYLGEKDDPLVSIILPTFNNNKFLGEAIRSVLEQKYQKFEIIIIDDGSEIPAREIVESIRDERIQYIYQENRGPNAARNAGIKLCRGKYLVFLDADDLLFPDKLELQVKELEENPLISCLFEGWVYIDEQGETIQEIRPWETHPEVDYAFMVSVVNYHGSFVRKQNVLDVGGFNETLLLGEDTYLFLRILAAGGRFAWTKQVLNKYRMHQNNITNDTHRIRSYITMIDRFLSTPEGQLLPDQIKKLAYHHTWLKIAQGEYRLNNFSNGMNALNQAINHNYGIPFDPSYWENVVKNFSLEARNFEPIRYAEKMLENLPESLSFLKDRRRHLLAAVYIDRSFYHYRRKNYSYCLKNAFCGLGYDLRNIENKGVLSIASKSIFRLIQLYFNRLLNFSQSSS